VQWSVVPVVGGVGTGTRFQQQSHHLGVAKGAAVVQRMQTAFVASLDGGAAI